MVAIRRRGAGDFWQGLWELAEGESLELKGESLKLLAKDMLHVLSHRRLLCDFYLWEVNEKPALPAGYIWVREEELDGYAKPRLIERLLELVPRATTSPSTSPYQR